MIISKAKRLTEALKKSDESGTPRSETIPVFVSDGIEIHTLTDVIIPGGVSLY